MRKLAWREAMKQLPRTLLFSFGVALSLFIIASVGSVMLTDGELAFGPREARLVFASTFVASFIFFSVRALLRGKK